ncbi:hypothetical protein D3C78_1948730 [compost metagenome]
MDLRVQRQVRAEAMLPVEGEAEEVEVERFGLVDAEDAQHGDGGGEVHQGVLDHCGGVEL